MSKNQRKTSQKSDKKQQKNHVHRKNSKTGVSSKKRLRTSLWKDRRFRHSAIGIAFISILWLLLANTSLSTLFFAQPAALDEIELLRSNIAHQQLPEIETLVSQYRFDFDSMDNHALDQLASTIVEFLSTWSQEIADDELYEHRLAILQTLMRRTNLHQNTQLCLCIHVARLRLIDALRMILAAMSKKSIKECFMQRSDTTHDTIFHIVSKSRSASIARLVLKLGFSNAAFVRSAQRLYLDTSAVAYSLYGEHDETVSQLDAQRMQKLDDVELVMQHARNAGLDTDWFWSKNTENYTAFDFLISNYGSHPSIVRMMEQFQVVDMKFVKELSAEVIQSDCHPTEPSMFPGSCSPPVIESWDEFDVYWQQQKPVILRGLIGNLDYVSIQGLVQRFSTVPVMLSEIPYGTLFGKKSWAVPIGHFFEMMNDQELYASFYAFDQDVIPKHRKLRQYFNLFLPYIQEHAIRNQYGRTYQLIMGAASTGSPPHWHQPAFNALYQGQKMWWIVPPMASTYSSMNIINWLKSGAYNAYEQPHYAFLQRPGDIVFVPQRWSHAVRNMEPSLAVAVEIDI